MHKLHLRGQKKTRLTKRVQSMELILYNCCTSKEYPGTLVTTVHLDSDLELRQPPHELQVEVNIHTLLCCGKGPADRVYQPH